jgi:hypothetical protein
VIGDMAKLKEEFEYSLKGEQKLSELVDERRAQIKVTAPTLSWIKVGAGGALERVGIFPPQVTRRAAISARTRPVARRRKMSKST